MVFVLSFQRKVEMFHDAQQSGMLGDQQDGYVSRTIAMVNCCPPLRCSSSNNNNTCTQTAGDQREQIIQLLYCSSSVPDGCRVTLCVSLCVCVCVCRAFVQRCAPCDSSVTQDSLLRSNKSLDVIIQRGTRELSHMLYLHIRVLHTTHCYTLLHTVLGLSGV